MNQLKEILRLHFENEQSSRLIALAIGVPRSTVRDYIERAKACGLTWPLPDDMTESALRQRLLPGHLPRHVVRPVPDWSLIHQELKKKGVILQLLWSEFKQTHPNAHQYTSFAQQYKRWAKAQDQWMPQTHKAGEEVYVDYSGLTVDIWDPQQREVLYPAQIFVAVLGASDMIFCWATPSLV